MCHTGTVSLPTASNENLWKGSTVIQCAPYKDAQHGNVETAKRWNWDFACQKLRICVLVIMVLKLVGFREIGKKNYGHFDFVFCAYCK